MKKGEEGGKESGKLEEKSEVIGEEEREAAFNFLFPVVANPKRLCDFSIIRFWKRGE